MEIVSCLFYNESGSLRGLNFMDESVVDLTPADRLILESYCEFCEGLSEYIGEGYEIILHSLENLDHSAIKVINGYHTGRTEGAPITNLALSLLNKIRTEGNVYYSYFSANPKGEPLKSSTIPIFGENHRIIGLLCMNFYLNTPFSDIIAAFTPPAGHMDSMPESQAELYMNDATDLINETIIKMRNVVLDDPTVCASNKNKEIICRLHEQGLFNLKNSIVKCAKVLGISKNTVYMHIRNLNRKEEKESCSVQNADNRNAL